jgi:predicted HicB family RNase H-like nuclease
MSDLLEYKGYSGSVEYSATDDIMYGKVLGIRSLLSYQGDSVKSLRKDFEDVINEYLTDCAEDGVEPEKPYKGNFNVRVPSELHRSLAMISVSRNQTLNSAVEEAIRRYVAAP